MTIPNPKPAMNGWLALSPLAVFLSLYLGTSICLNDFYCIPISVAFIVAVIYAVAITPGLPLDRRIHQFSIGASHPNVMLMVWIFILAGAFANSAKAMGAIDATVNLTLFLLPDRLLMAGIFLASCFISLSIGTSVGTVVALTPVAIGLAEKLGMEPAYMVAIVVGGSFFGDNLSFISDTTIAATRTQGCRMSDKFRANLMIVGPAAILSLAFYIFKGFSLTASPDVGAIEWWKVVPYILVLITAVSGVNVLIVLILGIVATGVVGISTGGLTTLEWTKTMGAGITDMGGLIVATMLAGGLLELIRFNGGIHFLIERLTRRISTRRSAEFSIAALVSLANLCTANNTIAIITTGPIAHDIAARFNVDKRKSASILDTFSCLIQSIIPYGAQLLMAAGLTSISPLSIIEHLYYPFAMGTCALLAIWFRFPKKYS